MAPDGSVFVCSACGKVSTTRYGFTGSDPGPYTSTASPGWDASCAMHAVLIKVAHVIEPTDWAFPNCVRRCRLDEESRLGSDAGAGTCGTDEVCG